MVSDLTEKSVELKAYLRELKYIKVYEVGNPTGYVTQRALYKGGLSLMGALVHATVGNDSLGWLAGGSLSGPAVSAHKLLPKDDFTVYKIIPDNYSCWHAGPSAWRDVPGKDLNKYFMGWEIENWNNGKDPFTESQYIKVAADWCYYSALCRLNDLNLVSHREVALHPDGHLGRKIDPSPLNFSWNHLWKYIWKIRTPEVWPDWWGVPMKYQ